MQLPCQEHTAKSRLVKGWPSGYYSPMPKENGLDRDMDELEEKIERCQREIQVLRERDQSSAERIGKAQEAQAKAERIIVDQQAEIDRLQKQLVPFHAALVSQRINAAAKERETGKMLNPLSKAASVGLALRKIQKDKKKAQEQAAKPEEQP